MKTIASISLGSSKRDFEVETEFGGQQFRLLRLGTDGSLGEYRRLLEEWDEKADALALGGLDLYVRQGQRVYTFRDAARLARGLKKPVVDGSGLKATLERNAVRSLAEQGVLKFEGLPVLLVAGIDRFGLAEELRDRHCELVLGDMMFALGVPVAFTRWWQFILAGRILLPLIVRLPFKWIYPTGEKQETTKPRFGKWYKWAELICGDFHFIRKYLPERLEGKYILTNTITSADRQLLKERGLKALITTTPSFGGRSLGTNVLEGAILLLSGATQYDPARYEAVLDELKLQPEVSWLQEG